MPAFALTRDAEITRDQESSEEEGGPVEASSRSAGRRPRFAVELEGRPAWLSTCSAGPFWGMEFLMWCQVCSFNRRSKRDVHPNWKWAGERERKGRSCLSVKVAKRLCKSLVGVAWCFGWQRFHDILGQQGSTPCVWSS